MKSSDQQNIPSSLWYLRGEVVFLFGAFLFLYTQLFQLPFTPYYFDGDQMISVSNGMRLLAGEVMYRDFFHLTTPGAEVVYAAAFAVFGIKVWVLNAVVLVLCLAIAYLTLLLSREVLSGVFVYLPATILLVVGFRPFYNDGSYRLFSMVFVLAAAVVLMKGRTALTIGIAGFLCGLASFFVQPRGVLAVAGILVFLVWESWREGSGIRKLAENCAVLLGPFLLAIFVTNSYFLWNAGFDNFYFSLVTFARNNYQHDPLSNSAAFFADIPELSRMMETFSPLSAISRYLRIAAPLLFFYFLPLGYFVLLVVRYFRKDLFESRKLEANLALLCAFGLPLIAGISAPSGFRFAHASMPALIIAVWLFSKIRYSRALGTVVLCALVLIGAAYAIQRQMVEKHYLDLPAGRSAFLSKPTYEKYKWVGENTRPGEIFYEPYHPGFYFPFHLENPTPMYLIRDSEYSPKFQIDGVLSSLEKDPPEIIIWPTKWSKQDEQRAPGDHLGPLWEFIVTNYAPERSFSMASDDTPYTVGDVEVWRRKR